MDVGSHSLTPGADAGRTRERVLLAGVAPGATEATTTGHEHEAEATFVDRVLMFTDIEASTARWEGDATSMAALMRHHDALVASLVEAHHGLVGARTGDGAIALFLDPVDAARCALEMQSSLGSGPAETGVASDPLRVRIGLHRGVVEPRGGEHYGPPMHRTARIMGAGHGGQVIASAVIADALRRTSDEFVLVDLGVHRLKGFHEPERLSELLRPGSSRDPRGARTQNTLGSLPTVDLSTLIGRDAEMASVRKLLHPGAIVTLAGPGGVGKTRLALQIAELARPEFADGAWFVDLAAVRDSDRVLTAIADSLGIEVEGGAPTATLRALLQERRMLVVVDNCEHLIDSVAAVVRSVMSSKSSATLLCTSQRDLGVEGEHIESIAPLDCASHTDAVEASAAGRFFLTKARSIVSDFELTADDREALVSICRRLDGLPLALELAAARIRVMSLPELADQLGLRFDLLRSRDQPDRHRTMTAAISWSMELLDDEHRSLLIDLSVFGGAFDWRAAAAVAELDEVDVLDMLDELTRRSLLVKVPAGVRMLVPVRLHCAAALERSGRSHQVHERHASWVVSVIPAPFDHRNTDVVTKRIDALLSIIDDVHAAHAWFVDHDPPAGARLALAVCEPRLARTRSHEAIEHLEAFDIDAVPVDLRLEVLGWLSAFLWTVGRNDEGEAVARRALDLAKSNGRALPVFAAVRLAVRLAFSNRLGDALPLAEAAEQELLAGNGEPSRQYGPLAVVHVVAGDLAKGVAMADEGVRAARDVGALRLLSALANRTLLQPGTALVAKMSEELATLAQAVGRTTAYAHAVVGKAHRALHDGDIATFLAGIAKFGDLVIDDEPTSVVGNLQWVPTATEQRWPRETAVLLAAIELLAVRHDHRGTDLERDRRAGVRERLRLALGDDEMERAEEEGQQMRLASALDLVRWMAETAD